MKIFKDDGLKTEMIHLNFFQANSFGKKLGGTISLISESFKFWNE